MDKFEDEDLSAPYDLAHDLLVMDSNENGLKRRTGDSLSGEKPNIARWHEQATLRLNC